MTDGLDLLDGYRDHTRARSTRTTVVLVDAAEDPFLDEDEARWALLCLDHGFLWADDDQVALRNAMSHPETWCRNCKRRRR